ncbi:hypothetical protein E1176_16010 [Fulvivirga sp. RKSG066]|uniref:hypothetical protein n=1 Tax=Fulvivirga aurantia TaxID=2529383 RepID=UPI0012BBB3AD|nr:hypothetical protein [Fulvivirga aurantia]MTI22537.1 hypothetical protein [Fulvivirga aurantia]
MRKVSLFFIALFAVLSVNVANAQDEDYLTDENLRRYAIMMEAVDAMKAEISVSLNSMIKNQEGIDGNRYKELSSGNGEPATEFEEKFMSNLNNMVEERKAAIGDVIKILATKMLPDGGKAYNAIKSAVASDEEVQARYEEILAQIQLEDEDA